MTKTIIDERKNKQIQDECGEYIWNYDESSDMTKVTNKTNSKQKTWYVWITCQDSILQRISSTRTISKSHPQSPKAQTQKNKPSPKRPASRRPSNSLSFKRKNQWR